MEERADFGVFTAKQGEKFPTQNALSVQRPSIFRETQEMKLVMPTRPMFAGADRYNVHIDQNSDDDVVTTKDF